MCSGQEGHILMSIKLYNHLFIFLNYYAITNNNINVQNEIISIYKVKVRKFRMCSKKLQDFSFVHTSGAVIRMKNINYPICTMIEKANLVLLQINGKCYKAHLR